MISYQKSPPFLMKNSSRETLVREEMIRYDRENKTFSRRKAGFKKD